MNTRFPPNRRRLAVVIGLVMLGLLAIGFAPWGEVPTGRPPLAAASPPAPEARPDPGSSARSSAAEAAAGPPRGADEVQVCGGAWVKLDPSGQPDTADMSRITHDPKARAGILDRMRASPNELARAVAVVLSTITDQERRVAMLGLSPPCEGADCPVSESARKAARHTIDAVARMAVSSTDPKVYGFAFGLCRSRAGSAAGACQMLSAEQWSRLDPGNAEPWQHILAAATARGDAVAQDQALFRIAKAQRSEAGLFGAAGAVLDTAPDDDAAVLPVWGLAMEAFSIGPMPMLGATKAMCRADALADANRRQICTAVAETLAERSDTLLVRRLGESLGKEVGWPAERSDRMRGEFESYTTSLSSDANPEADVKGSNCAGERRMLAMMRRHATVGEAGALREWVAKSGKTPDEFIREQRAREGQRAALATDAAEKSPEQAPSGAAANAAAVPQ